MGYFGGCEGVEGRRGGGGGGREGEGMDSRVADGTIGLVLLGSSDVFLLLLLLLLFDFKAGTVKGVSAR